MRQREILTKAIEKAIAAGWKGKEALEPTFKSLGFTWEVFVDEYVKDILNQQTYMSLLVRHDFAKALWGLDRLLCDSCHVDVERDDKTCWNCGNKTFVYEAYQNTRDNLPNWQYHLQQMVIADDPLDYLGERI